MASTKLNKWGNSQGAIIPKRFCDHLGLRVGDEMEVSIDTSTRSITLTCPPQAARRKKEASAHDR